MSQIYIKLSTEFSLQSRSVNNYFNSIAYLFPGSSVSERDPESNYGLEMYTYSPLDNFIRTDESSTMIGGE